MTTTIPPGGTDTYLPDRYDRLRNVVEILASDPAVQEADDLHNSRALRAYVNSHVDERILDGLSELDATTVSGLLGLDFLSGPRRIAGRISSVLNGDRPVSPYDDPFAVAAVLAEALNIYLAGCAGPEFTEARR